jgi:hypothetical protein
MTRLVCTKDCGDGNINLRVDTAVVLGHVGNLGPFTPDNLTGGSDETQFGDVDFDDGTLGQDTQLGVKRVVGVLLDGEDGQLNGDTEFGAGKKEISC